ncbi:MAG TPA: DMT family transporter [Candidatus Paceibacterota bacterium]
MTVLLLALGSAFFIGLNNVLTRKALDFTSRGQAILVSLGVATSIFLVLNIVLGKIPLWFVPGAFLFMLAGFLGPGIGRTFNITSAKRIGVSRTIPIVGTAPFFSTILAILFLGEEYSLYIFLGMALIIFGIFTLSRRKKNGVRVFDKKDLLLPLGSAVFGGVSITVSKVAIDMVGDPFVGVGLTLGAALFVVLGYIIATNRLYHFKIAHKGSVFPVFGGLCMASAFFLNYNALQMGSVSVVAPLFSTFPLFGVFLSHFFLKEEITGRTWLAAAIIVLGIAVIQAF